MPAQRSLFDRFWEKVDVRGDDECWLWKGARGSGAGYGAIVVRGSRLEKAHRVAWMLANASEVPDDMWVLHRCDNNLCVNPSHLFVGTRQDNVDDMMRKRRHGSHRGRVSFARGEQHGQAKLTSADVRVIRRRLAEGGSTQQEIATDYRVSRGLIGMIGRREIWLHV